MRISSSKYRFGRALLVALLIFFFIVQNSIFALKVDYVPTQPERPTEPWKLTAMDLFIPGYGMFKQDKFYWGLTYLTAKLAGGAWIYISWRNYTFRDSVYRAGAKRQALESDPLLFTDPRGSDNLYSLQELKNQADTAHLFFVLSLIGNALIYGVSAYHTYSLADAQYAKSNWHYKISSSGRNAMAVDFGYTFHF